MLKLLTISNLAVVSYLQVEFGAGLNVISGETGAGKSIILSALGLVLGERVSLDIIRTGESKAFVEGVFEIQGNSPLAELFGEAGIEIEDEDLIIKRELSATGRGKVFINNQSATLNLLKSMQPHLIDVHGQGEQQSLLLTAVQTSMLDSFAKAESQRARVANCFDRLSEILLELETLKKSEAERLQMLDMLEFQIQEIETIQPLQDEDAALEQELNELTNSEKLKALCSDLLSVLYDDDDSVISRLGSADRKFNELASIATHFAPVIEQLTSARYVIEDAVYQLRDYAQRVTFSPSRLEVVEERLEKLERLKRKHAKSIANIILHHKDLQLRFNELKDNENIERDLVAAALENLEQYEKACLVLTRLRRDAATGLEKQIKRELNDVALEKALFKIQFKENMQSSPKLLDLGGRNCPPLSRTGKEVAEYYFTANPGEEVRPLSAVASGGELSRLMLILKSIISPTPYPRTLVFDEIDAGIGGRVADAVGIRLHRLAKTNQLICVTHQAQIAKYADQHLKVAKSVQKNRTLTTIDALDQQGRISEIARMISGDSVSDVTRKHAEELLLGANV